MRDRPDTQRRLLQYLKPHRTVLIGGLLCGAITAAITVGIAKFIEMALDAMRYGDIHRLTWMCITVVAIFAVKGVFSFGQTYLLSLTANRVATHLRDEIYSHLHHLSLAFFNQRRTGAILATLTSDVPVLQNAAMSLKDAVAAPITICISLIGLFYYSWRLAIISLIFIPFMALVIQRIGRRIRAISRDVQGKLADLTTIIEETVSGVRIIKSFATEDQEIDRFSKENFVTMKAVMRAVRKNSQLRPLTEFVGAFGIALVLYLGGREVVNTNRVIEMQRRDFYIQKVQEVLAHPGTVLPKEPVFKDPRMGLTQGGLMAFVYLLNALARTAGDVGGIVTLRAQALAAAKKIFDDVLDVESEIKDKPGAIPLPPLAGRIRFENVCFRYSEQGPDVVRNVSFEARPGEVVALVGASGSGKSTLVDLIPRFYDPTEGRILVDGIDIRDVELVTLRRQIGIVPQETWLFAGTLRANIAYGNRDATDEEVRSAAYAANAAFVESMPERFDTIVGERGIRLSGGERQRIAIARAILMNPRILILDEATSSLDASSESLVQDALDHLMKGRTTIVIAHRLSTVVNADRILVIGDGGILEMGSHRDLLAIGGKYAELYERQSRGFEDSSDPAQIADQSPQSDRLSSRAEEPEQQSHGVPARSSIVAYAVYWVARLIFLTLRLECENRAEPPPGDHGLIMVTWHGRSLIPANVFRGRGYWALISLSRDGEIQTRIFGMLGFKIVRGSTGRGGVRGALQAARKVREGGVLTFTPDGPRGPTHKVQPGVVLMAEKSGAPIVPIGVSATRRWVARSWDGYMIPKPFARAYMISGEPIYVPPKISEAQRAEICIEIEHAINRLEKEAERRAGHDAYPEQWPTE